MGTDRSAYRFNIFMNLIKTFGRMCSWYKQHILLNENLYHSNLPLYMSLGVPQGTLTQPTELSNVRHKIENLITQPIWVGLER